MKDIIIKVTDGMYKELELTAMEVGLTMNNYIDEILFSELLDNLSHFNPSIKKEFNITDDDISKRVTGLRTARHLEKQKS